MIDEVEAALKSILGSIATLQSANGVGRIFELFVMTGIADALRADGYRVWLERSDETPILPTDSDRRFIQRGGRPTGISSRSAGAANAGYIVFNDGHGSPEWEIWNGIQFEGRSGGSHEIDIAIVSRTTGRALRALRNGGMPIGRPRVAIECKDVGSSGSVDEMRAFIARLYDISLLTGHQTHFPAVSPFCAIHPGNPAECDHQPVSSYWQENERTCNVIARQSGFVAGAAALSGYHFIRPHAQIKVTTTTAATLFAAVKDWCRMRGY